MLVDEKDNGRTEKVKFNRVYLSSIIGTILDGCEIYISYNDD